MISLTLLLCLTMTSPASDGKADSGDLRRIAAAAASETALTAHVVRSSSLELLGNDNDSVKNMSEEVPASVVADLCSRTREFERKTPSPPQNERDMNPPKPDADLVAADIIPGRAVPIHDIFERSAEAHAEIENHS